MKPTARTASPSCAAGCSALSWSSETGGQTSQSASQELHVSSPLHSLSPQNEYISHTTTQSSSSQSISPSQSLSVPSLQISSSNGGVPQSHGQLLEFSLFCLHIPSPQNGLPASAIFAIAQTKHAVDNNKTNKFLFDTIIFSF
jgi:hypothetical protein